MLADLTRNAVDVLPGGRARARSSRSAGRCASSSASTSPRRTSTSATASRSSGMRASRTRAHRACSSSATTRRGSAIRPAARPSGPCSPDEEIDAQRAALLRARRRRSSTRSARRCASTASGSGSSTSRRSLRLTRTTTVARLLERDDFAKRFAAQRADLRVRAPLPAHAGLRLRRGRGRRRARRHRPALQPARRPGRDGGLRPRAAGRADDVALPRSAGTATKMSASRGNYIGLDGAARGAVRQDDAHPGRAARPVVPARARARREPPPATRWRRSSRSRAAIVARRTGRRPRAPRRSTSPASCASDEAPDDCRRSTLPAGDPVHLPALLASRFGVASTSEARRLIAQGGVRSTASRWPSSTSSRARSPGAVVQAGKRRFVRLCGTRTAACLTPLRAAIIPRLPEQGGVKSPVTRRTGEPFRRSRIRPAYPSF